MKQINTKYLKSLNPCQDRLDNWIKYYKDKKIGLDKFLNLKKISHSDKVWVYIRSIDKELLSLVAADFAEQVLHIFEDKYPNDLRPRKAIEAARKKDINAASAHAAYAASAHAAPAPAAPTSVAFAAYAAARAASTSVYTASAYDDAIAYATSTYAAVDIAGITINNLELSQIKIMKKWLKK